LTRAVILVLDSLGIGGAEDAANYGDTGADTLGHIAEGCALGLGNRDGLRAGPLTLPNLDALGLGRAAAASSGRLPPGLSRRTPLGLCGYGVEVSRGKDTPSGHWEIAGTPVAFAWGYFPAAVPSFPSDLTEALIAEAGLPGILGNKHASGTAVIEEFGEEHLKTGMPICYTSVDSVFQIAASEETFGLERLYAVCGIARRLCDPLSIGRVIARPFVGRARGAFRRTAHRRDFAMPPPAGTLLARAKQGGRQVITIGKIGDIFAHQDTGEELKGANNAAHFELLLAARERLADGGLIFANFVDFDTEYGHRRDLPGYAACLEAFDALLPRLIGPWLKDDLLVITADHGNDPTWPGTDHTREHVPILSYGAGQPAGDLGRRTSLADIGETVARHLNLPAMPNGQAWSGPARAH
jgi:phosphopentomutase